MTRKLNILAFGLALFLAISLVLWVFNPSGVAGTVSLWVLLLVLLIAAGSAFYIFKNSRGSKTQMSGQTLLNSVKRTFKIVSAEGHFSDIIDFSETKNKWNLLPSTKKALMVVNGKVMMGYDFEKAKWKINEHTRKLEILELPKVEILSLSYDTKYYHLENGFLNKFKAEDHTVIQQMCKDRIANAALESDLPLIAESQLKLLLGEMGKWTGWDIDAKIVDKTSTPTYLNN